MPPRAFAGWDGVAVEPGGDCGERDRAVCARGFSAIWDARDRGGLVVQLVGQDKRDGVTWWPSCCLHIVLGGTTGCAVAPKWCNPGATGFLSC